MKTCVIVRFLDEAIFTPVKFVVLLIRKFLLDAAAFLCLVIKYFSQIKVFLPLVLLGVMVVVSHFSIERVDEIMRVPKICSSEKEVGALWGLNRMFNYDSVNKTLTSESKCRGIGALFLFIVTWLIGGGVMVSAIVDTTRIFFHDGQWRRPEMLTWGHSVILGWDENGVTVIREIIDKHRRRFFNGNLWVMPLHVFIVSNQKTSEIKSDLMSAGLDRWKIGFSVYHGEYDSKKELRGLNLGNCKGIYVIGERAEVGHDSRVMMLPERLKLAVQLKKSKPVLCELYYSSFALYSQLVLHSGQEKVPSVCVVARNFHASWAQRIFSSLPVAQSGGTIGDGMHFSRLPGNDVRVAIVGFSDMGQAFAIETACMAHYSKPEKQIYISIYDNELDERRKQFEEVFPRIDDIADIHWDFRYGVRVAAADFYNEINHFMKDEKEDLTVVVACDTPEMGMKCALPLMWQQEEHTFQFLLSQEVKGAGLEKGEESLRIPFVSDRFHVFGMFGGEGFNLWRRDQVACKLFVNSRGGKNAKDWDGIPDREKNVWRGYIDSLEEWAASEGFGIKLGWHNTGMINELADSFNSVQKKRINACEILKLQKGVAQKDIMPNISLDSVMAALNGCGYCMVKMGKGDIR